MVCYVISTNYGSYCFYLSNQYNPQNLVLNEQLMLISQLDEDEKNALVKIINSMLTKKRMKDLLDGKVNF